MTSVETRIALLEAAWTDAKVKVTVSACDFKCCGGGWQPRGRSKPYPQTYVGLVVSVNREQFLLDVPNPLKGKRADVLVTFDDLLAVEPIVD